MKLIAIEEHFLTPAVRTAWAGSKIAQEDHGETLHIGDIAEQLDNLGETRLSHMDESGIDIQVLSLTTPALQIADLDNCVPLARETNDLIAATIRNHPDRFEGFATLPTTSPADAARELERCVTQLGLKGAMLCGRTGAKNMDHQDFLPMLEAAAHLKVPLFIHPQIPQKAVRESYYSGFDSQVDLAFSTFGLGWHYEAGIQFLRLILAGTFDRFPELQIILGHWGEVVLFYTERIRSLSRVTKLQRPVVEYMQSNLYVTASGMFSPGYLERAKEIVGSDRILFSQDYPYQYRPGGTARKFVEELSLSQEEKEKFAHANWEKLTSQL